MIEGLKIREAQPTDANSIKALYKRLTGKTLQSSARAHRFFEVAGYVSISKVGFVKHRSQLVSKLQAQPAVQANFS